MIKPESGLHRRDSGRPQSFGQLPAGVKHPGLNRGRGCADNDGDFFDRFFVIVDEVDDLTVRRGKPRKALAQNRASLSRIQSLFGCDRLIQDGFHPGVCERLIDPPAHR